MCEDASSASPFEVVSVTFKLRHFGRKGLSLYFVSNFDKLAMRVFTAPCLANNEDTFLQ